MSGRILFLLAIALASLPWPVSARVVINEIMYHAPDDLGDLQYVELHNSGAQAVDLAGWAFTKGIKFKFPAGTQLKPGGFLVICRDAGRFKEFYAVPVAGEFKSAISHKGERIELVDAAGRMVDAVRFKDSAPWPTGADGYSGSLERINPEASGDDASSWTSSPLSEDRDRPAGTPGQPNAGFSRQFPPVIANVKFKPENPVANEPITVEADVTSETGVVVDVKLRYRLAGPGFEKPETDLAMKKIAEHRYTATIPGQAAERLVRFRIQATSAGGGRRVYPAETEPRPALSAYVSGRVEAAMIPFAWIVPTTEAEFKTGQQRARASDFEGPRGFPGRFGGRGRFEQPPVESASHRSAFVYFDPATRKTEVFDFVQVTPRKGGQKIHFLKDQMLREMSTINLIYESDDASLVEPLAYEVYRRAGMAAEQSFHVRLWQGGQPAGYQLLIEQPNRAFLRRNHLRDDGNLYKLLWYEQGVVGQHEKKTNTRTGHDDIVALVESLQNTEGAAQWEVIRQNFDVGQVVNYFAVNTVLSHWDGFFNNYFTYHDTRGSGKWTMYPWDQDSTWGLRAMQPGGQVFFNMPITFGMNGDGPAGRGPGRGFGGGRGAGWWRPPGWFSGPLLANPQFRKLFLARTREILETIYTEEVFDPIIEEMRKKLEPEARIRAGLLLDDPDRAVQILNGNLDACREHLRKRRAFLLAQDEIKSAGPPFRTGAQAPASR